MRMHSVYVLGPSLHRATNTHRAIDHRFHSQMRETGGTSPFLVGGFKHFLFSIIYGIILPINKYFSEGLKLPTSGGTSPFYLGPLFGSLKHVETIIFCWTFLNVCQDPISSWLSKIDAGRKILATRFPRIIAGWWFGTFFIFPNFGNNHPNWLIFFRGTETTNQIVIKIIYIPFVPTIYPWYLHWPTSLWYWISQINHKITISRYRMYMDNPMINLPVGDSS